MPFDANAYLREYLGNIHTQKRASELADKLLAHYGTIERVFCADIDSLVCDGGVDEQTAAFLFLTTALEARRRTEQLTFGEICSEGEIVRYLSGRFYGMPVECIYMITFDEEHRVIACDRVGEGTVNSSVITTRRLIETAVRRSAKYVILAHNHPHGNPLPSDEDRRATSALQTAFYSVGIHLLEHYVIVGSRYSKLIEDNAQCLRQNNVFTIETAWNKPKM